MYLQTFIPLFLAVHIPVENGVWEYGPEYVFSVNMYMGRPLLCVDCCIFGTRIFFRLYCLPKMTDSSRFWGRKTALSCRLRYVNGFILSMNDEDNKILHRQKNISDAPFELHYNEKGIEKIIISQTTNMYDLNILRVVVAEQLHPGATFKDLDHDINNVLSKQYKFEDTSVSTVGRCNVNFDIRRRIVLNESLSSYHNFRLVPLSPKLRINSDEIIVIKKTPDLDNCSCYAESYYGKYKYNKYSPKVDNDYLRQLPHLEKTISTMQIEKKNFVSSTVREGRLFSNESIITITDVILEDIRPAQKEAPTITKPGETTIQANDDIRSIST
ncbi:uncharacterized protein LOC109852959 [Pseudomyrmex gracilis]|uniref:uncharacterized protein LOC109852959 n=1 Tax=Pseudomyrmex gracilis TaxID=219809 RepID=UPI000995B05B|nr:uncharacterized protein LOC109852959 [Pseudomyrmex gracilis]